MGCGSSNSTNVSELPSKKQPVNPKEEARRANEEYRSAIDFVGQVPLFRRLPLDQRPVLAANFAGVEFTADDVVIKYGDSGDAFFIIQSGEAAVLAPSHEDSEKLVHLAQLKQGDYFGEMALLRDEPRMATVKAVSKLRLLKMTRDKFESLGLHDKLFFANRKAVGGAEGTYETKPPSSKTPEERAFLINALQHNNHIRTMVSLDSQSIEQLVDVAWKESVQAGSTVIMQGDLEAHYFYVIQDGSFEVSKVKSDEMSDADHEEENTIAVIKRGASFGELALMYLVPRAATVKAKEDGTLWVIDRKQFKKVVLKVSEDKVAEYIQHLNNVSVLECLLSDEKDALARAFVEMHFVQGEVVLRQGDPGNTFYILYDGEVVVHKDGHEEARLTASISQKKVHLFGERALLNNEPRQATVTVSSKTAVALVLDRQAFNSLLGPLEDLMKKVDPDRPSVLGTIPMKKRSFHYSTGEILRQDLVRIGVLGSGGFGLVELCEHKQTKVCYALKAISKGWIVKTRMQKCVMIEKNILLMTNSPFIVRLFETYNGTQTLYFLLEAAMGGELHATYNKKGFYGSDKHAKFYVASVVFAFQHLHERHVIFRDLKPENILLTETGHLKLTDMGLAKFVIGTTYTSCGTPEYFAPELITHAGHTNAVDWWTLGILSFELMSGHSPFAAPNAEKIYEKVKAGIHAIKLPHSINGAVANFVCSLLQPEPSQRLPMRAGGVDNLKSHRWFKSFDWDDAFNLRMQVPYTPTLRNKCDLANFTGKTIDKSRQLDYVDDGTGWDSGFATC